MPCPTPGAQAGIFTDAVHTKAKIKTINARPIERDLKAGKVVIVAGFQGINEDGQITTLGRGGSDLTAIALAAAVKADKCEIYTDVDGVYTADPRVVKDARKLAEISYDEMLELASSGSKVMQSRSVEFAKKYDVVFEVRSSFNHNPGTIVKEEVAYMEQVVVRGVAVDKDQAKVVVSNIPDKPGSAAKVFRALADANVIVDMIVQNVGHHGVANLTFTVPQGDSHRAQQALEPVFKELGGGEVAIHDQIAKLSVVGVGMKTHSGVAATLFQALAEPGHQHRAHQHLRDQDLGRDRPPPAPTTPPAPRTRRSAWRRPSESLAARRDRHCRQKSQKAQKGSDFTSCSCAFLRLFAAITFQDEIPQHARTDRSRSSFTQAVAIGLAPDGGLFLPETLPDLVGRSGALRPAGLRRAVPRIPPALCDGHGGGSAPGHRHALLPRLHGIPASPRSNSSARISSSSSCSTGRRSRSRISRCSCSAISTSTSAGGAAKRSTCSAPPRATRARRPSTACSASRASRSSSSIPTVASRRCRSGRWPAPARPMCSPSPSTARSTTRRPR